MAIRNSNSASRTAGTCQPSGRGRRRAFRRSRSIVRDPIGQSRISDLARGAKDPVVILDDLTRPTPTDRVVPFVLRELEAAGVPAARVTLVIATGTHGAPDSRALAKKAGSEAARACRA